MDRIFIGDVCISHFTKTKNFFVIKNCSYNLFSINHMAHLKISLVFLMFANVHIQQYFPFWSIINNLFTSQTFHENLWNFQRRICIYPYYSIVQYSIGIFWVSHSNQINLLKTMKIFTKSIENEIYGGEILLIMFEDMRLWITWN
jgi:hypothetical protein